MQQQSGCCLQHCAAPAKPFFGIPHLQELMMERQLEGGLAVPSPILSRVYHLLSEGLLGFDGCR
jgi:hypothetical protein